MIKENSGKVYRFKLDFDLGFAYANLIDFSDIRPFDGRLVYIYDIFRGKEESIQISEIENSKYLLGPYCLSRYPNVKGKGAWKLVGKTNSFPTADFFFKQNYGGTSSVNYWSKELNWFKSDYLKDDIAQMDVPYDDISRLTKTNLHDNQLITLLTSMYVLISQGKDIDKFYDLNDFHVRWTFLDLINTYYSKERCIELLRFLE